MGGGCLFRTCATRRNVEENFVLDSRSGAPALMVAASWLGIFGTFCLWTYKVPEDPSRLGCSQPVDNFLGWSSFVVSDLDFCPPASSFKIIFLGGPK